MVGTGHSDESDIPPSAPAGTLRHNLAVVRAACATVILLLSACTTSAGKMGEAGTLHTGEVVEVLTRDEILASREIHQSLNNSGVVDAAIVDGSVVAVRTLCCGPPNTSNPHGALNPQLLPVRAMARAGGIRRMKASGDGSCTANGCPPRVG